MTFETDSQSFFSQRSATLCPMPRLARTVFAGLPHYVTHVLPALRA
jgi:hypothetical protein